MRVFRFFLLKNAFKNKVDEPVSVKTTLFHFLTITLLIKVTNIMTTHLIKNILEDSV
jgi:hypothetical protein